MARGSLTSLTLNPVNAAFWKATSRRMPALNSGKPASSMVALVRFELHTDFQLFPVLRNEIMAAVPSNV
jgi:hypothetical protein